jgi:vacuolar-type H+-ATPase subunit F/Vma7
MRAHLWVLFGLLVSAGQVPAQDDDYRQNFIPPKTVPDFWRAINFEIDVGRFDLAADHLKNMLALPPTDEDVLALEKKEGMSSILKLRTIQKWSDNPKLNADAKKAAEDFIDKVSTTLKKHLADRERLAKFTRNLAATPEERRYAIVELSRSKALVVPFIMEALQKRLGPKATNQDTEEYSAIVTALPSLGRDTVPPLLAALDIDNPIIQEHIIEALRHRSDFAFLANRPETDPRPWLWHFAASPKHSEKVRKAARAMLAQLYEVTNLDRFAEPKAEPTRGMNADKLPLARAELTRIAERYYNHKVRFADDKEVTVWKWTDKGLISETVSPLRAEEYYGLHFARKALDLDPAYQPAQLVFVSLAVEKALEGNLDKSLGQAAPALKDLLGTLNPDLLSAALDRAISERRLVAALGLTRALGDAVDVRAARPKNQGQPVLVRALSFPDRRVQFAAADALLRIGSSPPPQASGRVVEVLRRAVIFDVMPRALVADPNKQRGEEVGKALEGAGFSAVVVQTGKEVMRRLQESGDIDVILIDYKVFDPEIADLLVQLRSDVDMGVLPLIITVPPTAAGFRPPDAIVRLQRLANLYRNVWVMDGPLNDPDILKRDVPPRIIEASGQPLTDAERKNMTGEAMVWLKRLATGEIPGYDVKPAETTILRAMKVEEFGPLAMEAASRIPTRTAQRELAQVLLDGGVRAELRTAAAIELNRHIQQNGRVLLKPQLEGIEKLHQTTDDQRLRAAVALVLGSLRPDATRTGNRLKLNVPAAGEPAPPPAPKEKDKEKEKEKEKDKDN